MREHEHDYELDVEGGFYYCECGESDLTIVSLMAERIACIENQAKTQARITALEGVVECAIHKHLFNNMPYPQSGINRLEKAITELPEDIFMELKKRIGEWITEQEEIQNG